MSEPLLSLRSAGKSYGSTRALSDVSFDVRAGEVHVLAGGNGAGKSTLIKILAGAIGDFEGELRVAGEPARFRDPEAATRAGVATIHQELSLVPSLSVLDNLFLGERRPLLSLWGAPRAEAKRILARVGLELELDRRVEDLGLAERQLVEIARALQRAARVLVLDEPTSALAEPEAERLFERIAELRAAGKGVVFISHRLDEIFRVADRITVLRDGRVVCSSAATELDPRSLIEHMVGELETESGASSGALGTDVLLSLARLRVTHAGRRMLDGVSLELHAGEILGVAGLQDSGASELLRALFGAVPCDAGCELVLHGRRYSPRTPVDAVARGVSLLARDRKDSVFPARPVTENVTLGSLRRVARAGLVSLATEARLAASVTRRMRLSAPALSLPVGALSGGNQQKVALARCLMSEPKLLLLDDPTRGVDVAAKADVHHLVRDVACSGAGVILVSSDFDELLALADRVLVLFRGRPIACARREELSRERLLSLCMGAS